MIEVNEVANRLENTLSVLFTIIALFWIVNERLPRSVSLNFVDEVMYCAFILVSGLGIATPITAAVRDAYGEEVGRAVNNGCAACLIGLHALLTLWFISRARSKLIRAFDSPPPASFHADAL